MILFLRKIKHAKTYEIWTDAEREELVKLYLENAPEVVQFT
jgi:hypothetical protein